MQASVIVVPTPSEKGSRFIATTKISLVASNKKSLWSRRMAFHQSKIRMILSPTVEAESRRPTQNVGKSSKRPLRNANPSPRGRNQSRRRRNNFRNMRMLTMFMSPKTK